MLKKFDVKAKVLNLLYKYLKMCYQAVALNSQGSS